MNIAHWLARTAEASPDRPALFADTRQVATYGAWYDQVLRVASALQSRGLGSGDRVALVMKNTPDYLVAQYAIWAMGAVAVPINAKLHPREVAWILENSGTSLVFATPDLADGVAAQFDVPVVSTVDADWQDMLRYSPLTHVADRRPDDLAWLFYTSGTTGRPKGVMITHRMLMTVSLSYQVDCDQVMADDAAIYAAPLSHGAGLYNMMHCRAGARHVFPASGGFDPAEVLDLAAHFGQAHLFMAPTMVQRLTAQARQAQRDGQGLKTIVYAGGPMYTADILDAVDQFGPVFVQIYGQGECPMGITALSRFDVADRALPRWRDRLGSVGRAQTSVEVRVWDQTDQPCAPGEIGEIVVRGDAVMPGYWQNPEATAQTLQDGWLRTGDMGACDQDGYVTLKDRSKDLIISGGSNIYPREVEEVLLEHPAVQEVAVIGCSHPEWGEDVVACIVSSQTLDPADLDAHCLERIARFKRPKTYHQLVALPKNNYGKVLKTELRARFDVSS